MKKICVLFGGKSTEHNVSIVSATSVISNLDKNKYEVYPVYISKEGLFYKYTKNVNDIKILSVDDNIDDIELIENIFDYFKNIDLVFPVLHGINGEDGTIQGMLEIIGKPYVGCKILASSICIDKVYTKIILDSCGIIQSKSMYIKKSNNNYIYTDKNFKEHLFNIDELSKKVNEYLKFPVFIKPSKQGSSVGVHKSLDKNDFENYLNDSFLYDSKVLIEETIYGREVECAILGNDELIASNIGEVLASGEFYTFDSKYKDKNSKTVIPANIDEELVKEIQCIAKKAYKACDCSGLSRIDFFVENKTNRIILNEINTLPGFTEISMYPKLIESIGISYSELLDKLIELA